MDRRIIEQLFLEKYGYRGDSEELQYFASDIGYHSDEPYLDYEQLRYHSQGNREKYDYECKESDAGNIRDEFGALFRDIIGKAKMNKEPEASHELMTEFAYMALLFLLKSTLYFVLRHCEENGYCYNL